MSVDPKADWSSVWAELDRLEAEAGELFPDREPEPSFREVSFDE